MHFRQGYLLINKCRLLRIFIATITDSILYAFNIFTTFLEEDFKAQELFNKRVLLAGLCKLIAFNMFDMRLAAPIFAQFLKVSYQTNISRHISSKEYTYLNKVYTYAGRIDKPFVPDYIPLNTCN